MALAQQSDNLDQDWLGWERLACKHASRQCTRQHQPPSTTNYKIQCNLFHDTMADVTSHHLQLSSWVVLQALHDRLFLQVSPVSGVGIGVYKTITPVKRQKILVCTQYVPVEVLADSFFCWNSRNVRYITTNTKKFKKSTFGVGGMG